MKALHLLPMLLFLGAFDGGGASPAPAPKPKAKCSAEGDTLDPGAIVPIVLDMEPATPPLPPARIIYIFPGTFIFIYQ